MAFDNYGFPFSPYEIQNDFMSRMIGCLDKGQIGIFESPTGTGKSLSLVCGALTWLKKHDQKLEREEMELLDDKKLEDIENECGDDWLLAHDKKLVIVEQRCKVKETIKLKTELENRLTQAKNQSGDAALLTSLKKRKNVDDSDEDLESILAEDDPDADLLIADSCTDDTGCDKGAVVRSDVESEYHCPKIFICSRTHSQLAQMLKEIQKTQFCTSVRVLTLGSRQTMCVNDAVKKLNSLNLINDRCLEMQTGAGKQKSCKKGDGTKKKCAAKCPYYRKEAMINFADSCLVKGPTEVESIVSLGRAEKCCPYYASRLSVPAAHIILLPYQTLLHKQTRDSFGLKLKDNVVVVDEAHNLLDAISSMHSVCVTGAQLTVIHCQLLQYLQRFINKLSDANKEALGLLISVVQGLLNVVKAETSSSECIYAVMRFLQLAHLDEINLFHVLNYAKRSQLAKKLNYFTMKYQVSVGASGKKEEPKSGVARLFAKNDAVASVAEDASKISQPHSSLYSVISFLECLIAPSQDGRILLNVSSKVGEGKMRYLLLNPASKLKELVKECRSVILAGGTMQPANELQAAFLHSCSIQKEQIAEFSCPHVIPNDQLVTIALQKSPCGRKLNLNFENRKEKGTLDAIGTVLMNVVRMVPGGVVVFFPSYDFESVIYDHLQQTAMLHKLDAKAKVFREPRTMSEVNRVLEDYGRSIRNTGKAQLWAVVGGKLSEGINFSDQLGRCVIMVGLPYPNKNSAELREKMKYLDSLQTGMGQIHYEALCMKAVNQSIGRAIRHRNDYASIILVDERYGLPRIQNALPSWIRSSLQVQPNFGPIVRTLKNFYDTMKTKFP